MEYQERKGCSMKTGEGNPAQPEPDKDLASESKGGESGQEKSKKPEKVPKKYRAARNG